MSRFTVLLVLILFAAGAPTATAQQRTGPALDQLMKDAIERWQLPGLAVAIVHEGRVVYLRGHGVKELGRRDPVTPGTVFPLASCTKAFTVTALGMLADDGKLSWDDPVRKHLPNFKLADPLASADVTLRDLLCHRTGIAAHDLLWYHRPWSLEERLRRVSRLEPSHRFRAEFEYQVVLFGAAGLAGARAAGMSWEELVRSRVLQPLGMKTASCTFPTGPNRPDLASPHQADKDGTIKVCERYPLDRADPAGSLHVSARDLAQFLRFQLGDGTWQGRRLLSESNLREPHTPQIVLRLEGYARWMSPDSNFLTYGLGWIVQDYRGKKVIMHGGAIDGFRTHLTLVPEAKLGIALLNNLDGTNANVALSNMIVDAYFGLPAKDWHAYYLRLQEKHDERARARAKALREMKRIPPPLPLTAYVGTYEDGAYGTCEVTLKDGRLSWSWGDGLHGRLEPFNGNTFQFSEGRILVDTPFTFVVGAGGRVEALRAAQRVFRRKS